LEHQMAIRKRGRKTKTSKHKGQERIPISVIRRGFQAGSTFEAGQLRLTKRNRERSSSKRVCSTKVVRKVRKGGQVRKFVGNSGVSQETPDVRDLGTMKNILPGRKDRATSEKAKRGNLFIITASGRRV